MATNQDALDAITDIKEAIDEYGSTIRIVTETQTLPYNPYNGAANTSTYEDTKALIKEEATPVINNNFTGSYDLYMKLYTTSTLTKANKIVFNSNTYEIVYVSRKILQDTLLIYELLVKK